MTSATDELRRMLDERGVEYVVDEEYGKKYPPEKRVTWSCDLAGEDMTVTARDYCISIDDDGSADYFLDLDFHEVFTPEQAIAATLGATDAKPTQVESSGTCEADETDLIPFVRADSDDFKVDYIHVMECTECGHVYEHVNGDYEYCPRCGRKRRDAEE